MSANRRGRPSLNGEGRTPNFHLRMPADLNDRLDAVAERTGWKKSEIIRDAIEHYLHRLEAADGE